MAYRVYVTDSLRMIPKNEYLQQRFSDVIRPHEDIDVDGTIERVIGALKE